MAEAASAEPWRRAKRVPPEGDRRRALPAVLSHEAYGTAEAPAGRHLGVRPTRDALGTGGIPVPVEGEGVLARVDVAQEDGHEAGLGRGP